MNSVGAGPEAWTDDETQQAEESIARFELAWHQSPPPDIESFLPDCDRLRLPVLLELVAIDKEFRSRRGELLVDSDYAARFPALAMLAEGPPLISTLTDSALVRAERVPETLAAACEYARPQIHARGGLGEILIVDDVALRRRVVVKRLQLRWKHNRRARRAFLQEAEITSRLEHPGIVPIHARGETPDGCPWYSMRFVMGHTLAEALQSFHQAPRSDSAARTAQLRNLLTHFVAVCNTIAYAHSRGVLHRDLKPANIMLGPFGETLVLDWGMAKLVGGGETSNSPATLCRMENAAGTAQQIAGEEHDLLQTVLLSQDASAWFDATDDTSNATSEQEHVSLGVQLLEESGTQQGDLVGTPAYMSPEQARGELAVGPATDVFGLGAILYAILTGTSPFQEDVSADAVRRAAEGHFVAPLHRKADVPSSLNAICCRAMASQPAERYASPADLADDVQRWLAGEPVSAFPENVAQRAARYVRRRSSLMAVLAALALVVPLALGTASWLIAKERSRREVAQRAAQIRSEAATQVTNYLTRIFQSADPFPFDEAGFRGAGASSSDAALRRMLDVGFELLEVHQLDEDLRSQLLISIGSSYVGLADYAKARAAIHESYELRRALFGAAAAPTLESLHYLARIAQDEGHYREAEGMYREVIAGLERLAPPQPLRVANTKYHLAWLLFYQPLGVDHPQFQQEKVAEAVQLFEEVLELRQAHLPPHDRAIGLALAGLAAAKLCQPGQSLVAHAYSAHAMEIFRNGSQESALGNTLIEYQRAESLRSAGQFQEADDIYRSLLEQGRRHLGENHPSVVLHLWNMAGLYRKMGEAQRAEQVITDIRRSLKSLPGFRSMPANIDGLSQYVDALASVDPQKARAVCAETLQYAQERPAVNARAIMLLEERLARQ